MYELSKRLSGVLSDTLKFIETEALWDGTSTKPSAQYAIGNE